MRTYRIVIVENDEDEQFFMKEGFEQAGNLFQIVAQLRNGDHLVSWLEANAGNLPDVILSDLNMPGQNGYDIIEFVLANPAWSHIPVIITSTSSTPSIMEKCLVKGAADYVVKPETFIAYVPYVKELHNKIEAKRLVK